MMWIGKFHQFDGCPVLDYERHAYSIGRAVGGNQNFSPCQFRVQIAYFKGDMGHVSDNVRDIRIILETHPFHTVIAVFMPNHEHFQFGEIALARTRQAGRDTDVVIATQVLFLGARPMILPVCTRSQ